MHPETLVQELVDANHILFDQGVLDAFGHVSVRLQGEANRFLLARSMAPALVAAADIMTLDLDGSVVGDDRRPPYVERFIHSAIYRSRPDVRAVVHSHSPCMIPFGVVSTARLRPVCHMSGFLHPAAPVFEIRDTVGGAGSDMLVRDQQLGDALARDLGGSAVILMRGHGSTAVGNELRQAVFRAIYAEVNAKLQAEAMRLGAVTYLSEEEAVRSAATNDAQINRAWELWKMSAREASGSMSSAR